jgi:beta-galactosidase
MKIGTYYYPEQWPREQWERDFDRMKGMGLQIVHLGEFAWGTMEPQAGQYNFDWLADCIELASKRKIDLILCTPTAVLPAWFFEKHPDAFYTGKRFGGRRHANHLHPAVQDYSRNITAKLAERFGDHPSVIGWQIDNEFNGPFDQSDYTHEAFRGWLRGKYESLDNLNKAWGTQFWNTFYSDWKQIKFPASREVADNYDNPHEHLDASRFWSWSFAQYAKLQADVLKPKIGNRWITTNFMPFFLDVDPMDTAEVFSMSTWDAYPVSGLDKNPPTEEYRMASPSQLGFIHDQMASYQGRWGQMELQPGTINWSGVPVLLYPGAVRLWIWTAFAHGAEFVTTYRFRQPLWGTELFHHGLIAPDGETMSLGGREFSQTVEEVGRLRLEEVPPVAQEYDPKTTVGILFDFEQLWYYKSLPQAKGWDQPRFLQQWYAALQRLGLKVKILHPNRDWPSDLKLIIAPGLQMVDDTLVQKMDDYATKGGHLVLTARTGIMNRQGHLWQGPVGKPILPLIGASIEAYDGLPEGVIGHVEIIDAGHHEWAVWGDLLHASDEARILVKYDDQFYAGGTAGVQKKHGQGVVTYSGVFGGQGYTDALVEKVVRQTRLAPSILPRRVTVMKRGPYTICCNYTDKPIDAPAKKGSKFVVGSKKVDPAGVAVWE